MWDATRECGGCIGFRTSSVRLGVVSVNRRLCKECVGVVGRGLLRQCPVIAEYVPAVGSRVSGKCVFGAGRMM